mmetsp:Transcript_24885/g.36702  ORF Transcript_24885/g.36702 Transcript_24885/m.36702 type:complete len:803 (-) Transcript_24885:125-2533(-)
MNTMNPSHSRPSPSLGNISLDPKHAAEHLSSANKAVRVFDMDDLGYNYLNVSLNNKAEVKKRSQIKSDSKSIQNYTNHSNSMISVRSAAPDAVPVSSSVCGDDGSGHGYGHGYRTNASGFPIHTRSSRAPVNTSSSHSRQEYHSQRESRSASAGRFTLPSRTDNINRNWTPSPSNDTSNAEPSHVSECLDRKQSSPSTGDYSDPSRLHSLSSAAVAAAAADGATPMSGPTKRVISSDVYTKSPYSSQPNTPADSAFIEWAKLQPTQVVVRSMEQQGVRADVGTDDAGNTLIHGACETGNLSLVHHLYELYPAGKLSHPNHSGLCPIHVACQRGMLHVVKFLLSNGYVSAGLTTTDGRTCLHLATQGNYPDLVMYLVDIMPQESLWISNSCGLSAMHIACMENYMEVVKVLTSAPGADLSFPDGEGRSSLDIACYFGHISLVKFILSLPREVRPDVRTGSTTNGYTCLHWACINQQYVVIKHLVQEEHLLTRARDRNGHTADQLVDDAVVSFILSQYQCVTMSENHSLSEKDKIEQQENIVNTESSSVGGASLESPSTSSNPRFRSKPYIPPSNPTFLPPKPNDDKYVPKVKLDMPADKKKKKVVRDSEWIKHDHVDTQSSTDKCNDPPTATEVGDHKSEILSFPSSENEEDSVLFTLVVNESNIPKLEGMLGVAPNIKRDVRSIKDSTSGNSLLHTACQCEYLSTIQFLVEGVGSDVNSANNEGQTSLHCAVASERVLNVRYLVKYCGAALDVKDNGGRTPMDLCMELPEGTNREELKRILSKAHGKPASQRTKISIPTFSP